MVRTLGLHPREKGSIPLTDTNRSHSITVMHRVYTPRTRLVGNVGSNPTGTTKFLIWRNCVITIIIGLLYIFAGIIGLYNLYTLYNIGNVISTFGFMAPQLAPMTGALINNIVLALGLIWIAALLTIFEKVPER